LIVFEIGFLKRKIGLLMSVKTARTKNASN